MENLNDLIWVPESEDNNGESGDYEPNISYECESGIEDACLLGTCQIVGNTYACLKDAPKGTIACKPAPI